MTTLTEQAKTGALDHDAAVAIDPGSTTGVAVADADGALTTYTSDFWAVTRATIHERWMEDAIWVVEAPYKRSLTHSWLRQEAEDEKGLIKIAQNVGGNHREAELLVEGLCRRGYDVVEHDPQSGGGSWSSKAGRRKVVEGSLEWDGPANEHCIDALFMLTVYGFAG